MICFLTSSPVIPGTFDLNGANGFIDALRACFPANCWGLFICSDPADTKKTDRFAGEMRRIMARSGFLFQSYGILDGRNASRAAGLIREADFIILAGGHVPTQNRFFAAINLKELLRGFDGVLMGISAGTMNSAETVYAQPEREGEALDPGYRRFLPGLGLTKTMVLPHYQLVKNDVLDGQRLFEDITYPDSMGRVFYALPDGSYLLIRDGKEELRGESHRIGDGLCRQVSAEGDTVPIA